MRRLYFMENVFSIAISVGNPAEYQLECRKVSVKR